MAFRTGIMFPSLTTIVNQLMSPFFRIVDHGMGNARTHLNGIKALATGVMIGSAIALPVLLTLAGSKALIQLDFVTMAISTISFGILHQAEITENGPIVIGVLSLAGFLALMSPQKSLTDFAPFLPLSLTAGLLTATSVVPWFKKTFQSRDRLTYGNILLATGGDSPMASDAGTVDPNSTRSNDRIYGNVRWPFRNDSLAFAHIGGAHQEMFPMLVTGEDISNLDLESGLHRGSDATSASDDSQNPFLSSEQAD